MSDLVTNKHLLEQFLGYFPTFHDDEILSMYLDHEGPSVIMRVLTREWTNEFDEKGYMKFGRHGIVSIRFSQVTELQLEDWYHFNCISELVFEPHKDGVETTIEAVCGLVGKIVSGEVNIDSVTEVSQQD